MGYELDEVYPPCNRPGTQVAEESEAVSETQPAVQGPDPDGVVPFVLSLLGFFFPLLIFVALYLAVKDRKHYIAQGRVAPRLVTAAWIISIVGVALELLAVFFLLLALLIA